MTDDDTQTGYLNRLQADFPDLKISSLKLIGKGWDHVALEANSSVIFRLPRGQFNLDKLSKSVRYETAVLRLLQSNVPVSIPNPLFVAPKNAYFGYPKLSGVLANELLASYSKEDFARLIDTWTAAVLAIQTSIPVECAVQLGVPKYDISKKIETAREIYAYVGLEPALKLFVGAVIDNAAQAGAEMDYGSFIHNDMHLLNVLADPLTNKMTGIIDWSDCCLAPLSKEFSVWEWSHDDTLDKVTSSYERASGCVIDIKQARLWKHIEEIADVVEQKKGGDQAGADRSLDHIRQWAVEGNWKG